MNGWLGDWLSRPIAGFAPRDFGVSPYFAVVKPPPTEGLDHAQVRLAK